MNVKELKNPCTMEYVELKKLFQGFNFPWFYNLTTTPGPQGRVYLGEDYPFYSHTIMERPNKNPGFEKPYSTITSDHFKPTFLILQQIFSHNKLDVEVVYRISLNVTFAVPAISFKKSNYHTDLNIPHQNMIIYLSKFEGGELYIKDDTEEIEITPQEDDIISFDGDLQHCAAPPVGIERRMIMVVNFLCHQ